MESLQGHLLVAAPHQLDPNFVQTVVLVVQHMTRGAFGLIVNCPASQRSGVFWERLTRQYCTGKQQLHFGGPVTGPLMAVHTDPRRAEIEILPGLFFTAKADNLLALAQRRKHAYKLFVGYTGWGPRQLEYEVDLGVWRTVPAMLQDVLSNREALWDDLSRRILRSMLQTVLHVRYIPADPWVN
jgi:putative transcriptional regulator